MFEAFHNWVLSIGAAIASFFMNIDGQGLLDSLEIMGVGYLGIFIVIGIIILAVYVINWLFREKE